ncbi:hypothetical protein CYMTET_40290 [Cymbomonas tetramitiformis]|uniref:Uncharacterized protein n=1 Tax=Cymbomonas tetramitiformis TaxID=36881 RepID=A0AAE0F3N4_9CHLO|nr:hypothetical protein CYMTET_40290 [Cymbomonas tetramitiformis]
MGSQFWSSPQPAPWVARSAVCPGTVSQCKFGRWVFPDCTGAQHTPKRGEGSAAAGMFGADVSACSALRQSNIMDAQMSYDTMLLYKVRNTECQARQCEWHPGRPKLT